jgi:NADPH:quinone reductase-like Zn-dependent oxidoreductase
MSMKTMQVNNANQGAVLIPVEVPQPEPGPDEVLIHVHAVGVTPTELLWYTTTHTKEGAARTSAVPGHEFSGVVAALGANVHTFEVGDEVYGMNDWFASGATAEFCVTLPENIAKKPATLSYEAAAAVPISSLTAWQGLLERAKLQPGERVLVQGGAGAVGLFAVQVAHLHGAYVIATVAGRDIDFVKQLGADEVIDYTVTPFEELVQNADVVFDSVGCDTRDRSWSVLKPGGRMVTIAADSEAATDQHVKDAFFIVKPNQKQLVEIAKQLDDGRLKAFVKAAVPLDQASTAYSGALKSKSGPGKFVIVIPASTANAANCAV